MTSAQLVAFVITPLALLAIGWGVALAFDWRARHDGP
jgi:hypothetical protein